MAEKRKDKARTVLKTGEVQRKNGTYQYSLYTFIMEFGLPVDFQAVDEYNKYQWRIAGFHSSTYIIYIKTYIIRVPNCRK